jgi:hypothetical protein
MRRGLEVAGPGLSGARRSGALLHCGGQPLRCRSDNCARAAALSGGMDKLVDGGREHLRKTCCTRARSADIMLTTRARANPVFTGRPGRWQRGRSAPGPAPILGGSDCKNAKHLLPGARSLFQLGRGGAVTGVTPRSDNFARSQLATLRKPRGCDPGAFHRPEVSVFSPRGAETGSVASVAAAESALASAASWSAPLPTASETGSGA